MHREPRDLRARVVQIGVERRQEAVLFRIARLGVARLVGALDGQWAEQHAWGPAWSAKAGLELGPAAGDQERTRRWSVLMQYYNGPSPYGQFFSQEVTYAGVGLQFSF